MFTDSHNNNVFLSVFALMSVALLFAIMLFMSIFTLSPPIIDKKAVPFTPALPDSSGTLKESTGILGQVVYDNEQQVVGTLYDAYINPKDGKILWMSVNVSGMPDADLVLLPINETSYFAEKSEELNTMSIRMDKNAFMDHPRQKQYEAGIVGLISLRDLPDSAITDSQNNVIGKIIKITYRNGFPDLVYFAVQTDQATMPDKETQVFALPFEYVVFADAGSMYGQTRALLTERQAGAIEAFLKNIPLQ